MSIQEHLNKIRNAVYGHEVRESIAKGIETAYDDASENDNANMEVKLARGTNPNLNTRLNKMDETDRQNTERIDSNYNEVTSQLAQKAQEVTELKVSNAKKAEQIYVDSGLNNKRDKGVKINNDDIDVSTNKTKIGLGALQDEVKQAMTGQTPVFDGLPEKSIVSEYIADNSVSTDKRTMLGSSAFIQTLTPIEIDTYEKTITFPLFTVYLNEKIYYGINGFTKTISDGQLGLFFDTATEQINVRLMGRTSGVLESEVMVGFVQSSGSSQDTAFVNATNYTVNGENKTIANDSLYTNRLKALNKNAYFVTSKPIDVSFETNRIIFKGNSNILYIENQAIGIPEGTSIRMTTQPNAIIYFNVVTKEIKTTAIRGTNGVFEDNYVITQEDIILGTYQRETETVTLNANYTINGEKEAVGSDGLPDYMIDELDKVVTKNSLIAGDLKFAFATDIHLSQYMDFPRKMKLLGELGNTGTFDFIAIGGDVIDGGQSKLENARRLTESFRLSKDSYPSELFVCQGNHDTGFEAWQERYDWSPTPETVISPSDWHNMAAKHLENKVVMDEDNLYGGYYYKDFNASKIRVIVLNTSDCYVLGADGNPKINPFALQMLNSQIQWLQHKALNFMNKEDRNEWQTLILSHGPLSINDVGGLPNRHVIEGILNAYMSGGTYEEIAGTGDLKWVANSDFTEQGPMEFVGSINGHLHYERVTKFGLFDRPCITVPNMSSNEDYKLGGDASTQPAGVVVPSPRVRGEVTEEAFNLFTINKEKRKIYITGYGAANDRVIPY